MEVRALHDPDTTSIRVVIYGSTSSSWPRYYTNGSGYVWKYELFMNQILFQWEWLCMEVWALHEPDTTVMGVVIYGSKSSSMTQTLLSWEWVFTPTDGRRSGFHGNEKKKREKVHVAPKPWVLCGRPGNRNLDLIYHTAPSTTSLEV